MAALADEFIDSYWAIGRRKAAGVDAEEAAAATNGFVDLRELFNDKTPLQGMAEDYLQHRAGRLSGGNDE